VGREGLMVGKSTAGRRGLQRMQGDAKTKLRGREELQSAARGPPGGLREREAPLSPANVGERDLPWWRWSNSWRRRRRSRGRTLGRRLLVESGAATARRALDGGALALRRQWRVGPAGEEGMAGARGRGGWPAGGARHGLPAVARGPCRPTVGWPAAGGTMVGKQGDWGRTWWLVGSVEKIVSFGLSRPHGRFG
jgi:hypothetical protein